MFRSTIAMQAANTLPKQSFVRALNHAYQDYYIPVKLNKPQFEQLLRNEAVQLEHSVAATRKQLIVGTGLLGIRNDQGWIGGVGVRPKYRGHGVGSRILAYLVEQAEQLCLSKLQLEVVVQNSPAVRLYKSAGFEQQRELYVLSCWASDIQHGEVYSDLTVRSVDRVELIPWMRQHALQERPWQQKYCSAKYRSQNTRAMIVEAKSGEWLGGCLTWSSPTQLTILDIVTLESQAQQVLLKYLSSKYHNSMIYMANIADQNPQLETFRTVGFGEALRQYEMILPL